jgi:hypothetical protein
MSTFDFKEGNDLIAYFMGYTYRYITYEDLTRMGNNQKTLCHIYSKVPLEIIDMTLYPSHWEVDADKMLVLTPYECSEFPSYLEYHEDWNYLMEVISAIESTPIGDELPSITLGSSICEIISTKGIYGKLISHPYKKLTTVWELVVEFLQSNEGLISSDLGSIHIDRSRIKFDNFN